MRVSLTAKGVCCMDETEGRDRFRSLRERVEALLREAPQAVGAHTALDLQTVLQELSACQRALEAQNEAVTATRRQFEAARDSYRRLFEFAPLGYYILDRAGLILEVNLEGASLLGGKRGALIGRPFMAYVGGESRQSFELHRMRVFETGLPGCCELTLQAPQSGVRHVELHSLPVPEAEAGERRCLTAVTDLTDRRRAEGHSRHLAAIVESSNDAIIGMDLAGRILSWNAGAERFYGYRTAEMLGRPVAELAPSERKEEVERLFEAARQGRIVSQVETVRRRKDGDLVDVSLNVSPICDATGRIAGLSCIARDITARKRLRRELVAARREAEAANHAKSEFLANMSHEIRNPINAILGLTRLVLSDAGLSEKQVQRLSMVLESSESLLGIVGDILDYSKIEAGKLELDSRAFALRRLLGAVIEEQRVAAEHKGLSLTLGVDPAVPDRLRGDPQRLRQVLVNLIGNALKFTDVGLVRVKVALATPGVARPGKSAVTLAVSVSDTGIGIAPAARKRIFDSFVQADSGLTKRYAGSGLGLAICRQLTELMGGAISVESELGRGSTFRFTAVCSLAAGPEREMPNGLVGEPADAALPPLSILLAEDNRINQLFTVDLLTSHGHTVVVAASGAEVLEKLCGARFDLVLMDVQMPVMDGVAATKAIRGHAAGLFDPAIPIIGLSAYAMTGDRERFMGAGMDDYLTKPVRFEDFFQAIRRTVLPRLTAGPTVASEGVGGYDAGQARVDLRIGVSAFCRVATLFRVEYPGQLDALHATLAAGDAEAAGQAAHVLAGSAAVVRAEVARDLACRLELALRGRRLEEAQPLARQLEQALAEVAAALQASVGATPPTARP